MPVTYFWMVNYMPLKSQQIQRDYFHYWHFNNILERTKLQEAYDHRERLLSRMYLKIPSVRLSTRTRILQVTVSTPLQIHMTLQTRKLILPAAQNDNYYILDKQLTPHKREMKPSKNYLISGYESHYIFIQYFDRIDFRFSEKAEITLFFSAQAH